MSWRGVPNKPTVGKVGRRHGSSTNYALKGANKARTEPEPGRDLSMLGPELGCRLGRVSTCKPGGVVLDSSCFSSVPCLHSGEGLSLQCYHQVSLGPSTWLVQAQACRETPFEWGWGGKTSLIDLLPRGWGSPLEKRSHLPWGSWCQSQAQEQLSVHHAALPQVAQRSSCVPTMGDS